MKELKFVKPSLSKVVTLSDDGSYGKFEVAPLERGFGITIGNALRRTLLSSLPGAAFVNFKLQGAQHEFQSVAGIVEDVITIVLNLKRVILKVDSTDWDFQTTVEIHHGEGEVTAGDIIHGNEIEIINPDQHICTVARGGSCDMVLTVRRGVGYVNSNENKVYSESLEVIAIDSIYTPITNVAINVDKTRVEDDPNFDKLTIEITTNGSIDAKDALAMASKMMIEHLNVLVGLSDKAVDTDFMIESNDDQVNSDLSKTVEDLDLSQRAYNGLKRASINTVADLTNMTSEEIQKLRCIGAKSVKEIRDKLESMGLGFKKN